MKKRKKNEKALVAINAWREQKMSTDQINKSSKKFQKPF